MSEKDAQYKNIFRLANNMDIFVGVVLIDNRERIYLIKEDDKIR